jgi:hypothetical protein
MPIDPDIIDALNAYRHAQTPPLEPSEAINTLLRHSLIARGFLMRPADQDNGHDAAQQEFIKAVQGTKSDN